MLQLQHPPPSAYCRTHASGHRPAGWPVRIDGKSRKPIDFHDFASVWRRRRRNPEDFGSQTMNTHTAGAGPGRLRTRIFQISRAGPARDWPSWRGAEILPKNARSRRPENRIPGRGKSKKSCLVVWTIPKHLIPNTIEFCTDFNLSHPNGHFECCDPSTRHQVHIAKHMRMATGRMAGQCVLMKNEENQQSFMISHQSGEGDGEISRISEANP